MLSMGLVTYTMCSITLAIVLIITISISIIAVWSSSLSRQTSKTDAKPRILPNSENNHR